MKGHLRQIVAEGPDRLRARSLAREYIQARILQMLQENRLFRRWIFHGGTALRFLYGLPRHSEDLDFALEKPGAEPDFAGIAESILRGFQAEGYAGEVAVRGRNAVLSAFLRFSGLYHDLGLSPHRSEVLSVKFKLDSRPPAGGQTETSVIRRHAAILNIKHYDKSSLLSGKLHAILARPYTKGRDLYDLLWYLADPTWPEPNIRFLAAALRQTRWSGPEPTRDNWKSLISRKLSRLDWEKAVADVRPFLERPSERHQLTKENVLFLLSKDRIPD
jgi:hypothetical protein